MTGHRRLGFAAQTFVRSLLLLAAVSVAGCEPRCEAATKRVLEAQCFEDGPLTRAAEIAENYSRCAYANCGVGPDDQFSDGFRDPGQRTFTKAEASAYQGCVDAAPCVKDEPIVMPDALVACRARKLASKTYAEMLYFCETGKSPRM